MENIKEKIGTLFGLYFSYMFLAVSGATIYVLITFAINYSTITITLICLLIIAISIIYIYEYNKNKKANKRVGLLWLKISKIIYSERIQKEVFLPIMGDWQEEYFEALFKKEIWKARWINVRYTYAFIVAMWQKSPIGDLIEFIQKIAK